MISNPKDKVEINHGKVTKSSTTSARQWFGLRNPRIVRVSRSFGGKDRHSKVCTIKGLRDRRIRLSVPTAIQLYDLQERLGLGQPSKVIDWLLEVTKLEIDKLPPLPFAEFGQFPHDLATQSSSISPFFDPNSSSFMKDVEDYDAARARNKGKWIRTSDYNQTNQDRIGDFHGGQGLYLPQMEDHQPSDNTFFAPSGSQLIFCPPLTTMPAIFTPYPSYITTQMENEQRQFNHIQFLHPFPKLLLSQHNSSQEKDNPTGS